MSSEAVDSVLKELDAFGKQTLIVCNKIDNRPNREPAESYGCSAFTGQRGDLRARKKAV